MKTNFTLDQLKAIAYGVMLSDDLTPSVIADRDCNMGQDKAYIQVYLDKPDRPFFEILLNGARLFGGYRGDFDSDLNSELEKIVRDDGLWNITNPWQFYGNIEWIALHDKKCDCYVDIKRAYDLMKEE